MWRKKKDEDNIKPLSAIIPEMNMIKMSASCFPASPAVMRRMRCCCKLMTASERRTVTTACTTIKRSYLSHCVYDSKRDIISICERLNVG